MYLHCLEKILTLQNSFSPLVPGVHQACSFHLPFVQVCMTVTLCWTPGVKGLKYRNKKQQLLVKVRKKDFAAEKHSKPS